MARLREGEYGWRCRLGLIVPSLNVVAEPEMRRLAPDGVSVHSARMYLAGATTPESYARMAEDAEAAADLSPRRGWTPSLMRAPRAPFWRTAAGSPKSSPRRRAFPL